MSENIRKKRIVVKLQKNEKNSLDLNANFTKDVSFSTSSKMIMILITTSLEILNESNFFIIFSILFISFISLFSFSVHSISYSYSLKNSFILDSEFIVHICNT